MRTLLGSIARAAEAPKLSSGKMSQRSIGFSSHREFFSGECSLHCVLLRICGIENLNGGSKGNED